MVESKWLVLYQDRVACGAELRLPIYGYRIIIVKVDLRLLIRRNTAAFKLLFDYLEKRNN